MANRVITRGSGAAAPQWGAAIFCLLIQTSYPAHAEDLPDPTRPPAGIFAPAAGHEAGENLSSGLHTIIISDIRRAAIIDGQTVELGGEHGGARLIEVNEGGVVLQRAQSRQVLSLFPGVKISRKGAVDTDPTEAGKVSGAKESLNQVLHKENTPGGEAQVLQQSPTSKMPPGVDNTKSDVRKEDE